MSDSTDKKDDVVPEKDDVVPEEVKQVQAQDDDHQEDQERILAGRYDVNYPALLTKDVPGG